MKLSLWGNCTPECEYWFMLLQAIEAELSGILELGVSHTVIRVREGSITRDGLSLLRQTA